MALALTPRERGGAWRFTQGSVPGFHSIPLAAPVSGYWGSVDIRVGCTRGPGVPWGRKPPCNSSSLAALREATRPFQRLVTPNFSHKIAYSPSSPEGPGSMRNTHCSWVPYLQFTSSLKLTYNPKSTLKGIHGHPWVFVGIGGHSQTCAEQSKLRGTRSAYSRLRLGKGCSAFLFQLQL